jgi:hypothetical protein
MTSVRHLPTPEARVEVVGDRVTITGLTVVDPTLAGLVRSQPVEDHPELLARILRAGAQGLVTMGIGLDVASVDAQVRQTLGAVLATSEERLSAIIATGEQAFAERFDPDRRSSLLSRALEEFTEWRDALLDRLDPNGGDSHTTEFLQRIADLVGPQGVLEQRLRAALDPHADGSLLAGLADSIDTRFDELRTLIVHSQGRAQGRAEEAARGTAQGLDFEDTVEAILRSEAGSIGGCLVERVSSLSGELGPAATVGDFTIELPGGHRIVVEAKNQASLTLSGKNGILEELDRAMANRRADFGICISAREAFPAEVGNFGVYGDRVLVVDDGDGALFRVAMRWAVTVLSARGMTGPKSVDATMLAERVDRIRILAERFKTGQRSLTAAGKQIDGVRDLLREMRTDLLDLIDDIGREIATATLTGE